MEAIVAAAMEIASHANGVEGIRLTNFIPLFVAELSLVNDETSKFTLSWSDSVPLEEYGSFKIPYLSPGNDDWPESLYHIDGFFLGYLQRTANSTKVDIAITREKAGDNEYCVTGEARNYDRPVSLSILKECLMRVKSEVHFVVVSQLQRDYFVRSTSSWEEFCSHNGH